MGMGTEGQLGARGVACFGMLRSSSQLSLLSEVRCTHLPPIFHAGRVTGPSHPVSKRPSILQFHGIVMTPTPNGERPHLCGQTAMRQVGALSPFFRALRIAASVAANARAA